MRDSDVLSPAALARRLDSLGFPLPEDALAGLHTYLSQLMKWNKVMNLVGTRSWRDTLDTLVADSFHLADFLRGIGLPPAPATVDLGAGAGLPGIPLRLVWPDGRYTLVEVREKRALFMRTVLSSLNLPDTEVFQGKAEDFFAQSEPADCILSRAFMPWRDLLSFVAAPLAPALASDGRMVFLALEPAPEALPAPWRLLDQTAYTVHNTERHFWCLSRVAP